MNNHYTMSQILESSITHIIDDDNFHVIIMCGLPGRGKSYMSHRLCRWLHWKNNDCQVFNAGSTRRKYLENKFVDHKWFNSNNELKEKMAEDTLKDLMEWIIIENSDTSKVGIFDATNTTRTRREKIINILLTIMPLNRILFIESICDIDEIIRENFITDKRNNDDYKNLGSEEAEEDFRKRIGEYEKVYQSLDENFDADKSFIKIYNLGQKFIINKPICNFQNRVAYFLLNLNKKRVTIYLTRHGQSQGQVLKHIGGNSQLTEHGKQYAQNLKRFFDSKNDGEYNVLHSELIRSKDTASVFRGNETYKVEQCKVLNEIYGGEFEGLSFGQVEEEHPNIYKIRNNNKYHNAWPGGESYYDLTTRLESILLKIENTPTKLVIIAHQAICRIIYAYLMNIKPDECVNLEIKSHRLFEFSQDPNNREMKYHDL